MHYGIGQTGFEKHKDVSKYYNPDSNKKNIYDRKLVRSHMPATRDRFIANPMSNILAPKIAEKREANRFFHHDKLDIKDIAGAIVNTYGKQKNIQGRNYMDLSDIDKTRPQ